MDDTLNNNLHINHLLGGGIHFVVGVCTKRSGDTPASVVTDTSTAAFGLYTEWRGDTAGWTVGVSVLLDV